MNQQFVQNNTTKYSRKQRIRILSTIYIAQIVKCIRNKVLSLLISIKVTESKVKREKNITEQRQKSESKIISSWWFINQNPGNKEFSLREAMQAKTAIHEPLLTHSQWEQQSHDKTFNFSSSMNALMHMEHFVSSIMRL